MRNKVIVIVILLGIVMIWYLNSEEQPVSETIATIKPTIEASEYNKTETTVSKIEPLNTSRLKQVVTVKADILAEIESRLFSDDDYIELLSLKMVLGWCNETGRAPEMFSMFGETNQSQLELIDQLTLSCEQHVLRYPHIINAMQSKDWLSAIYPESQLGHLLKNRKNYRGSQQRIEQNQHIFDASMRSRNSTLILHANRVNRFDQIELSEQIQLINSQDRRYTHEVNHIAINLLACQYQAGIACQSTSSLMIYNCAQFPAACGLDFNTWYNENMMPGMKKDVDILLHYYRETYL